ncbi:MAG: hypothetical protein ACYCO5_07355 [Acidobacteriaceae bacterium]
MLDVNEWPQRKASKGRSMHGWEMTKGYTPTPLVFLLLYLPIFMLMSGTARSQSPQDMSAELLSSQTAILENDISAVDRNEALAQRALQAGQAALADATAQQNAQAQAVANHAIEVANEVLQNAQKRRADDEAGLEAIRDAAASQSQDESLESSANVASMRANLAALRAEVAGIQEALRRMGRSEHLDAAQRRHWEDVTNQATADAWKQGIGMATDGASAYTSGLLRQQLRDINTALGSAATKLAGETDPNRREQLGAAIKLLEQQKHSVQESLRTYP